MTLTMTVMDAISSSREVLYQDSIEWNNGEWSMGTVLLPVHLKQQQTLIVTLWDDKTIVTRRLATMPRRGDAPVSRVELVYPCAQNKKESRWRIAWYPWMTYLLLLLAGFLSCLTLQTKQRPLPQQVVVPPPAILVRRRLFPDDNVEESQCESCNESEKDTTDTSVDNCEYSESWEEDHSANTYSRADEEPWSCSDQDASESPCLHQESKGDHGLDPNPVADMDVIDDTIVAIDEELSYHYPNTSITNATLPNPAVAPAMTEQAAAKLYSQQDKLPTSPIHDHVDPKNDCEIFSSFQESSQVSRAENQLQKIVPSDCDFFSHIQESSQVSLAEGQQQRRIPSDCEKFSSFQESSQVSIVGGQPKRIIPSPVTEKYDSLKSGEIDCKIDMDSSKSYVSTLPPDSDLVSDEVYTRSQEPNTTPLEWGTQQGPVAADCTEEFSLRHQEPTSSSHSPEPDSGSHQTLSSLPATPNLPLQSKTRKRERKVELPCSPSRDSDIPIRDDRSDMTMEKLQDENSSVEIIQVTHTKFSSKRRKMRPFASSQIVPDWVPSRGLQSASNNFVEDSNWNMMVEGNSTSIQSPSSPVPKSINIRRSKRKSQTVLR